jgi:hypothetical protein
MRMVYAPSSRKLEADDQAIETMRERAGPRPHSRHGDVRKDDPRRPGALVGPAFSPTGQPTSQIPANTR